MVGNMRSAANRPIGPQCTYSIKPSLGLALGAIHIVPPVYALLLKVRKRHGRRSHSRSSSQRTANGSGRHCASRTKTPSKYPRWPKGLKWRFVNAPTLAVKPTLTRLNEYISPEECVKRIKSIVRVRLSSNACKDALAPSRV